MMTPEDKAKKNILNVLGKLRQVQIESGGNDIEYRLGSLSMGSDQEMKILNSLVSDEIIGIEDSWGNNSFK